MTKILGGKWFKMNAQSSINAYELAQILQTMQITLSEDTYNKLDKNLRRHFHETEIEHAEDAEQK